MKNKLIGFCISLLLLLLLLMGCNNASEPNNDTINLENNSSEQEEAVQPQNEPNYMKTMEIARLLEEAIVDVNNFEMSADELDLLFSKHMKPWVYDEVMAQFEYSPHLIDTISNGVRTNKTVMLNDVKGMSVQEIKEIFKDNIDNYNEEYYGSIIYEPFQVSKAYDDGYFIYVFVKQQLTVDKIHDIDVQDVTLYKKYIFVLDEGKYKITDLNQFAYFIDELNPSTIEWFEKEKVKYEVYKDGEIWKE